MKETAIVICPGRGTYSKPELGYFGRYHGLKSEFLDTLDAYRGRQQQVSISDLDGAATFSSRRHTTGDNASLLIYACALADFADINQNQFDIVGVTGNSMGWYLALACAGVLGQEAAMHLVNTMGVLMHEEGPGGQIIYPLVDENWLPAPALAQRLQKTLDAAADRPDVFIAHSIHLGGMAILAANDKGLAYLQESLPPEQERYPLVLPNHGGFHSELMKAVSKKARDKLKPELFLSPQLPLIDGFGRIWQPGACSLDGIYDYTLRDQICQTYDYSKAIEVAIKEFAPDKLIILGPGTTLGAPTAQVLIAHDWLGLADKNDFTALQRQTPFVLSMGYEQQRQLVTGAGK